MATVLDGAELDDNLTAFAAGAIGVSDNVNTCVWLDLWAFQVYYMPEPTLRIFHVITNLNLTEF